MFNQYLSPIDQKTFLSIVVPAHNEEKNITETLETIVQYFYKKNVFDFEIVVVNDNSSDQTENILKDFQNKYSQVRYVNNTPPHGFGFAIRKGIESFKGLAVCFVMADLSDSPEDIFKYYLALKEGHECVFGSRFIAGSKVKGYPILKYIINRFANYFVKFLFSLDLNDTTNAFKAYRREVIEGISPILSCHFNLTVELPLKAIVRGYQYKIVPITWENKRIGKSNLVIKEMGSRYLFIVLYVWLEKTLARGDYKRRLPLKYQKNESTNREAA